MSRLPPWIRASLRTDRCYAQVRGILSDHGLNTVCQSARCPNLSECWNRGTATIMILGHVCTRGCSFCAVDRGRPLPLDREEPARVAAAVAAMKLKHAVITSVTRDDLEDGGADAFAETVRCIRAALPESTVEVLTPDFGGRAACVERVLDARPDIFSHNLETVRRLQPVVRPQASYERSLDVLRCAAEKAAGRLVKSGLMVGMGETDAELVEAMSDLRAAGCGTLTLGQYLAPTREHLPVARYVSPAGFEDLARVARGLGFAAVAAGPLVRSSYRAEELFQEARAG